MKTTKDGTNNLSTDLLFLACAYVGDEPATAFFDFCKNYCLSTLKEGEQKCPANDK